MKQFFLLLFFFLSPSLLAQEQNPKIEHGKQELMNIDSQFSNLSETRGVNEAFLSYIADDGVLLRKDNFPIVGKEIIKERFFSRPDSGYTLTWKPLYSDIAESGELGYTYGIYEFKAMDPEGKPIIGNGTYVSVWKKDASENWKLVLDTGNEGLESK
jgi:ketosteroid isomerase-like protein